ncbi:MAG: glutathione S-transferase N-terminal domain-containing protein [Candidatus Parcubacteria bacterium]|nr:glutathione S-transferase N-terminal domain-containing protein [Candidatus Parcubacteria bacterium]
MKIKIFSSPTCPWCQVAKDFFKDHGLEFEAIDLTEDPEALEEVIEKTGQMGVPVIKIDDEYIVDFDKKFLLKKLNLKE